VGISFCVSSTTSLPRALVPEIVPNYSPTKRRARRSSMNLWTLAWSECRRPGALRATCVTRAGMETSAAARTLPTLTP